MSDTPLENLIANICDTSDLTDAEVREELAADGVDVDAAKARTMAKTDELMRARAVRLAIAAVKANPSDYESPLPWRADDTFVFAADGTAAAHWVKHSRAAHIAAAVNAVPLLIAEAERLQAQLAAARVAVEKVSLSDTDDHHCIENLDPVTRACLRCVASHSLAEARRVLGLEGA